MKKLSKKILSILVLGSLAACTNAFAAEEVKEFELDQLVVTAQRTETKDLETPAAVTVITKEDIEIKGATTLTEALRMTAGITDNSYNGNGDDFGSSMSRVYLRGFDKGALVMVNGAPINIFNYSSLSGIPVEAIERIEIVRGAQSVLYGAEAMGGVVNVITKTGEGPHRTMVKGTVGNYIKKASIGIQGKDYVAVVGRDWNKRFTAQKRPAYSGGQYRDVSNYMKDNIFVSGKLSPNLTVNWIYNKMNPMYTTRMMSNDQQTGSSYRYDDLKNIFSLIYEDKNNGTKTILGYNSKRVKSWSTDTKGKVSQSDSSNYIASNLYLDTQKKWDIGKDTLIAGLNLKHEKYEQIFSGKADNQRNSAGIYLSYKKKFNDKFDAILGIRGQFYGESDWDKKNSAITPQLQTTYKIDKNSTWYTNIGKAFEMPSINSHTSAGGTSADVVRANGVKPEEGWNYETGYKRITDSSAFKAAVFFMDYKNKFAWKNFDWLPDPKNKIQVNVGRFKNQGLELEYTKRLSDKWSYNFNATWQNPRSEDEGESSLESAKLLFNAGADYKLSKFRANINLMFVGKRENSYYDYGGAALGKKEPHALPNRFKLNAGFSYAPTKDHKFALNFYNILNRKEEYVSTYEYLDLPFNWTLSYEMKF